MNAKKRIPIRLDTSIPLWWPSLPGAGVLRPWLPSRGSVLFTLLVGAGLIWAQAVGAVPGAAPASPNVASTGTVAYQGRLADPAGAPLTGTYGMIFRLYAASTGGAPLWEEQWTGPNSAQVSDGLFNVMLGSLTPIPQNVMTGNSSLWLGITVGSDDEMAPRVQLGSVPFAVQAGSVEDLPTTVGGSNQPLLNFVPRVPSNVLAVVQTTSMPWTELDLTEATSATATAVLLNVRMIDEGVHNSGRRPNSEFRRKGWSAVSGTIHTAAPHIEMYQQMMIPLDESQILEYQMGIGSSPATNLRADVIGYWEPASGN